MPFGGHGFLQEDEILLLRGRVDAATGFVVAQGHAFGAGGGLQWRTGEAGFAAGPGRRGFLDGIEDGIGLLCGGETARAEAAEHRRAKYGRVGLLAGRRLVGDG